MWGSRKRHRKRRVGSVKHSLGNIRERVRRKTVSLKKTKLEQTAYLQGELGRLAAVNESLHGRSNIHTLMENRKTMRKIQSDLDYISKDRPYEEFVETVKPLLNNYPSDNTDIHQKQQALFLHVFHEEKAMPCFVDREVCPSCNTHLVTKTQESVLSCPKCGHTEYVIQSNTEYSDGGEKHNHYERGPLYQKYLMQFHEDAPDPPQEVIDTVYRHLSKVHIMLSTKVKPTPIAQILRDEKLQQWAQFSVRIAKYINSEPIPSLSGELIGRLVSRFNKITQAFAITKMKKRKKIMNFEFLTKQFLFMENRPDLAEWFCCHKTRLVLKQADSRLARCSKLLTSGGGMKWDVGRSC